MEQVFDTADCTGGFSVQGVIEHQQGHVLAFVGRAI